MWKYDINMGTMKENDIGKSQEYRISMVFARSSNNQ